MLCATSIRICVPFCFQIGEYLVEAMQHVRALMAMCVRHDFRNQYPIRLQGNLGTEEVPVSK